MANREPQGAPSTDKRKQGLASWDLTWVADTAGVASPSLSDSSSLLLSESSSGLTT